jgi:hypothetical protein
VAKKIVVKVLPQLCGKKNPRTNFATTLWQNGFQNKICHNSIATFKNEKSPCFAARQIETPSLKTL